MEEVALYGLVIGLIGPDASGKTTLATAIHKHFVDSGCPSQVMHLGSPRGSRLTRLARLAMLITRKFLRIVAGDNELGGVEVHYPRLQSGLDLVLAYERLILARRCHRLARQGVVVVADRYPCATVGSTTGPQPVRGEAHTSRLLWAQQLALYERIPRPTLVVCLRLPIEDTVRRNAARLAPKAESVIRASHAAAKLVCFEGVPELVLDSTRAPEQLLADVIHTFGI
jgi:thymidylate kinase